jgi:GMP synthase (glutamine-hydrolysing)
LPKGAELLAEGEAFLHQAFRIGQKTLALQFHPEVTYAMICRWTTRSFEKMNHKGARAPHEHREGWFEHDHDVEQWLNAVLDGWIGYPNRSNAPT